jgi:hypothetical protein
MNFLKTSGFLLGFAVLGIACGDSSSNTPDAPIIGGNGGAGGSHADAYVAPGTGGAGAGGATVATDSGAGGATVVIDSGAGGAIGPIDANHIDGGAGGATGTVDSGAEAGSVVDPKAVNIAIINAVTTSVGLTVAGPAAVPYTSCK